MIQTTFSDSNYSDAKSLLEWDDERAARFAAAEEEEEEEKRKKEEKTLICSYANDHPFAVLICPHTYPFQATLPFCIYLVGARFCKGVKVSLSHRVAPIYALRGLCEIDFI